MSKRMNRSAIRDGAKITMILVLVTSIALLALLFAGCGGTNSGSSQSPQPQSSGAVKQGGTLKIFGTYGLPWPGNFNPLQYTIFTPTYWGMIYEPLWVLNSLATPENGAPKEYPWLATGYTWSTDHKTLTFKIRQGVKWSDGQPFSAADVVFTFNLIKKFPACDVGNAWANLNSVSQQGTDGVVMSVKPGAIPGFQAIATATYIVPEHIWSKVSDPVKYVDRKPVGTGPFLIVNSSPQVLSYARNPNYWQAGKPYIDKIIIPAYTSNNACNRDLANDTSGAAGEQYVPDIKNYYIAKDPANNHYWFPSVNNWSIFPNLQNKFLKDPLVRQAISYAINRAEVAEKAEYNYTLPASQTGVMTRYTTWYDKQADSQHDFYNYNPEKAASLLTQAGFTRGSDGIFRTAAGEKLSLSIICASAFSDSVSACQIMANNLKQAGIDARNEPLAMNTFYTRSQTGQFDLAWQQVGYGYVPYYELDYMLNSKYAVPIGQTATANYERWKDPATDQLLAAYGRTADPAAQQVAIKGLQKIMLEQVPVIPILQGVAWCEWSEKTFVGWPTETNPYANPALYVAPDLGVTLTTIHLR